MNNLCYIIGMNAWKCTSNFMFLKVNSAQLRLTLIPAWMINNIHYKVWGQITHPFQNFNCEVLERIGNFLTHFTGHITTYSCWVKFNPSYWKDPWLCFYQTRSAWSMDQGSTRKRSAAHNFAPTVTKFCVMWEGLSLPHDTKFSKCRGEIVDRRMIFIWTLIHGSGWSGLIKSEPAVHFISYYIRMMSISSFAIAI